MSRTLPDTYDLPFPSALSNQLKALAARRSYLPRMPPSLSPILTPLDWKTWQRALHLHHDREFARLIVEGVREGFRIGYNYDSFPRARSAARKMASAYQHPEVVSAYLADEYRKGRVLGPLAHPPVLALK